MRLCPGVERYLHPNKGWQVGTRGSIHVSLHEKVARSISVLEINKALLIGFHFWRRVCVHDYDSAPGSQEER